MWRLFKIASEERRTNDKIKTACEDGDIESFKFFVKKEIFFDIGTISCSASYGGNIEFIDYLIDEWKITKGYIKKDNACLLFAGACARNNLHVVSHLINRGFIIYQQNLREAVHFRNLNIFKLMFDNFDKKEMINFQWSMFAQNVYRESVKMMEYIFNNIGDNEVDLVDAIYVIREYYKDFDTTKLRLYH